MPAALGWIIKRYAADPTSGSLRTEAEWMIERGAADATSASLREADLTGRSLRLRVFAQFRQINRPSGQSFGLISG